MSIEYVLKGSSVHEVPDISVGEYFLPRLKSLPKNHVILVDAETGESETTWQFLTNAIYLLEGLRKLGLQENDVVAMLCRNVFEANHIMLAAWLGAAVVSPINGLMKVFELKPIFDLIKPKFVFCEEEMIENISSAVADLAKPPIVVLVDKKSDSPYNCLSYNEILGEVNVDDFKPPPVKNPSEQLIMIVPSSGTTGLPKGIGITHKNIIFQDKSLEKAGIFDGSLCGVQISHFFWVTAIEFFIRSLSSGLKRISMKNVNSKNILLALARYKADFSLMTPMALNALVQHLDFRRHDLSSVKYVLIGGSALTESTLMKIKKEWPNLKLIQIYGMTEASGNVCFNHDKDTFAGKVCPGVELKVIDRNTGESLKSNTEGEICVKSPGLMKGYVNNEKATKEKIDENGWFHTGDAGFYDDSQKVYVKGRMNDMFKVEGNMVEPETVENIIENLPGVGEVAVAGVPQEDGNFLVVAFVVKKDGYNVTEKDIYDHVEKTLARHNRLTGGVFFVESIPKTGNGKIRRSEIISKTKSFLRK